MPAPHPDASAPAEGPPVPRPARHQRRAPARAGWRRRGDALLGLVLAALAVAGAATLFLVTVPVVGTGTALLPDDRADRVLVVLTGDDAAGVARDGEVSVVWVPGQEPTAGRVAEVDGPRPAAELAGRYGLPGELLGAGDAVVAEVRMDAPVPGARPGLSGTATAYLDRRPLFDLFVGRGVTR